MEANVSSQYLGERGEEYWEYQEPSGRVGGVLEARKFAPYVRPDDDVIDFGCGGGFLLERLDAAGKTGIEPNPAARARARVPVVAHASELPDASADLVITNHALEHTQAPVAELAGLHRLLRPQGRLVIFVPLDDWRRKDQRVYSADEPNHHLQTWTPLLLGNTVKEAGFTVAEAKVVTNAWPPMAHRMLNLPEGVFEALSVGWAALSRRRQVVVVAHP